MPPTRPGLPQNGPLLPSSVSTPGGTTVAPVLSMSSQPGRQIGGPHVTSVTGTSGPQGSQSKPSLSGQVLTTPLCKKKQNSLHVKLYYTAECDNIFALISSF